MSKPTSPTYKTTNWAAYNEALKRRGSLTIWFDPEMNWDARPSGKRGRSRTFSDAAIQTCLTMKVLFGMALRQTTGFVESLLRLTGRDWDVPDFSTICRRQRTLAVNIPYRGAKGPLHLLIPSHGLQANHCRAVDSTGIKVEGEGEWNARKHGGPKRRVWRKIHIHCPAGDCEAICREGALMSRRWKSEPSRSRVATRAMHRCCLICSTRFRAIRRLAA
jgi:hypothetical protein